jgi:hypothetical protein
MAQVELSKKEVQNIDKAIRILRDRHYRSYHNAKDQNSNSALSNRNEAERLDQLRFRIIKETH